MRKIRTIAKRFWRATAPFAWRIETRSTRVRGRPMPGMTGIGRKRRSGNKWYSPEKRLAQVYGLSPQDYDAMLAEQGGVCAICKTRPDKPLFVDHCHATGKVRGLLCHPCNAALGFMRDDPRLTAAATEYLLKAAARGDKPK